MKIFYLSIFTIFLLFVNPVNSEQKIAFIDMDRVISTSKVGSSILKQLNVINNKNLTFLKKEEKRFKEKEKKLISQKNIISEVDFNDKFKNLKSEINEYNQNRAKLSTDFDKLKIDNTNKILKSLNLILAEF